MGLLFMFLTFLTQILFDATDIVQRGTQGQEQSGRELAARRPLVRSLEDMAGPRQRGEGGGPEARLVVQWADAGFRKQAGRVQVLRSTVRIDRQQELDLLRPGVIKDLARRGNVEPEEVEIQQGIKRRLQQRGYRGRADMLLLAWPQGDKEGAFLELRRGLFLSDEVLPFKEARGRHLLQVREIGAEEYPPKRIPETTEVVATGLLYLEYRFQSQYSQGWEGAPGNGGPEWVWDSARAGWFGPSEAARDRFTLDLAGNSLADTTDDVFPHWVQFTLVVGRWAADLPEAILANSIGPADREAQLLNVDNLPDRIWGNYVKIGSEWVRFSNISGRTLKGLKRGLRDTPAKAHDAGTGVRVGETRVGHVRVLHGRDNWNG